jgi:hypothetical protein
VRSRQEHHLKEVDSQDDKSRDGTKEITPGGKRRRTNRARTNPKRPRSQCYIKVGLYKINAGLYKIRTKTSLDFI